MHAFLADDHRPSLGLTIERKQEESIRYCELGYSQSDQYPFETTLLLACY
jgi:hypothetical protein